MINKCMKSVGSGKSWAAHPEIIVLDFKEEALGQQVQENTIIQEKQCINKIIMIAITKIFKRTCFKVSTLAYTTRISNNHCNTTLKHTFPFQ